MDWPTQLVREDQVVVGPRRAGEGALEDLRFAMRTQRRDRLVVQGEVPSATPTLRGGEHHAALDWHKLLHDLQPPSLEVHVLPPQPERVHVRASAADFG